jgi:GWxTD domain-containing protein
MRKLCAAGFIAALTLMGWAALPPSANIPDKSANLISAGNGPEFRCQLGQRLGTEPDSLRMIAAISVPYDNLIFLRTDSGFAATFDVVTALYAGDTLITERITRSQVQAGDFAETNSRMKNAVHVDEFHVLPGTYQVRVTLSGAADTRRKSKWEGRLTLDPSDVRLRVSDIYWVSEDVSLEELGLPRVEEGFSSGEHDAQARIQLYSTSRDPIHLTWTLYGERGDVMRTSTDAVTPDSTIKSLEYALPMKGLPAQQYMLKVEVEGNGRREVRTRSFSVRIPGIPQFITDLEAAIRQLKYIASSEEYSKMKKALPAEREQLFKDFWKRQAEVNNSTADELMDEYYERVKYANERFRTNHEGWDTDRGRIYIRYGEPTDVERHPFEPNTRPYEIWFYSHLARRFIFVDYTGFGDYSLITPEWGY